MIKRHYFWNASIHLDNRKYCSGMMTITSWFSPVGTIWGEIMKSCNGAYPHAKPSQIEIINIRRII
jgi:hypothetical protein